MIVFAHPMNYIVFSFSCIFLRFLVNMNGPPNRWCVVLLLMPRPLCHRNGCLGVGTTNGRRLEDRVVVVESDFAGG